MRFPFLRPVLALAALALLAVSLVLPARADLITFTHTWTGTETLRGTRRLTRNGVTSMAPAMKPFPGTDSNNTFFVTLPLDVLPGSIVSVTITAIDLSFLSLYGRPFNPADLAANYLGDVGISLPRTFSVTAPASGLVEVVANSTSGNIAIGSGFSADVTFTPAPQQTAIPEPGTLVLLLFGTLTTGARLRRRRPA